MDKVMATSALATFGLMLRQIKKYYNLKQISHLIKTSIQLDTSFETVTKELSDRTILLAASIKAIRENNVERENYILSNDFIEPDHLKENSFTFRMNQHAKVFLTNFEGRDLEVDFERGKFIYFDAPGFKVNVIKDEGEVNKDNYYSLSIADKIRIFPLKNHEK